MATVYLDFVNGSDSNSGLTPLLPKKTYSAAEGVSAVGDTILIAKCGTVTTVTPGGGNFVWTRGSSTIAAPTGHGFVAGNWIGSSTAAANGSSDGYYYVASVTATSLTLLYTWGGPSASLTEASAKKMTPLASTTIANTKSLVLIGGYTPGETWTRDGETLISATTGNISVFAASTSVSYLNCYGTSNYCFYGTTTTDFSFCSGGCRTLANGAIVFNTGKVSIVNAPIFATSADRGTNNITFNDGICVVSTCTNGVYSSALNGGSLECRGCGYGSYSCTVNGGSTNFSYNGTAGNSASTINGGTNVANNNTSIGFSSCTINGGTNSASTNGLYGISACTINGGTNTSTASTSFGVNSTTITGGTTTATGNTYGLASCTVFGGTVSLISNLTAGASTTTFHGLAIVHTESNPIGIYQPDTGPDYQVTNWTSLNDVVGLQMRDGRGKVRLVNCAFTTPVTYAIAKSLTSGCVECVGCSIDTPSIAKAYQVVSGASYAMPQYVLQNSFGVTGVVYANATILQNTTTSPYSLDMTFTGTSGLQKVPLSILKLWVKQGTALTVSVQYKAPSGTWSGTIVPYLLLNGKTILTGDTISSVGSSPATLTFSPTAQQITSDGVLEIAVVPNSNSVTVNWSNPTYQKN